MRRPRAFTCTGMKAEPLPPPPRKPLGYLLHEEGWTPSSLMRSSSPCQCGSCERDSPSSRAVSTPPSNFSSPSRVLETGHNHNDDGPANVWHEHQHQQPTPPPMSLKNPISPNISPVGLSPAAGALVMSRKSLVSGRRAPARRIVLFGDSALSQQQQPSPAEGRMAGGLGVSLRNQSERKRGSDEARGISSGLPPPPPQSQMLQTSREDVTSAVELSANSLLPGSAVAEVAAAPDDGTDSAVQATADSEITITGTATVGPGGMSAGGAAVAAAVAAASARPDGLFLGCPFSAVPSTVMGSTAGVTLGGSGWNPSWPRNLQHSNGSNYDVRVSSSSSSPLRHPSPHTNGVHEAPFHDRLTASSAISSFTFPANPTPASAALIPGAIGKDDVADGAGNSGNNGDWKAPEAVTGTFSLGSSGKESGVSTRRRRLRMRVGG